MKALFELFRRFDARRIFGFIRRLGGMSRPKVKCYDLRSTHALRVEGDSLQSAGRSRPNHNFYPRPPGGGRHFLGKGGYAYIEFLSTPSGWRATCVRRATTKRIRFLSTPSGWRATYETTKQAVDENRISIHALRVEGDMQHQSVVWINGISIHALRVEGDSQTML